MPKFTPFGLRLIWDRSSEPTPPHQGARRRLIRQADTHVYAAGDIAFDMLDDPGVGGVPVVSIAPSGRRGCRVVILAVEPQTPVTQLAGDGTDPFAPATKAQDHYVWAIPTGSREFWCVGDPSVLIDDDPVNNRAFLQPAISVAVPGLSSAALHPGPSGPDDLVILGLAPTSDFPGNAAGKGAVWRVRFRDRVSPFKCR